MFSGLSGRKTTHSLEMTGVKINYKTVQRRALVNFGVLIAKIYQSRARGSVQYRGSQPKPIQLVRVRSPNLNRARRTLSRASDRGTRTGRCADPGSRHSAPPLAASPRLQTWSTQRDRHVSGSLEYRRDIGSAAGLRMIDETARRIGSFRGGLAG